MDKLLNEKVIVFVPLAIIRHENVEVSRQYLFSLIQALRLLLLTGHLCLRFTKN